MTKIFKVNYGEIEVYNLIKECLQSFKVESDRGFKQIAWKNKQYSGCWGFRSYCREKSFTDKNEAISYAQQQLVIFTNYHQKLIGDAKEKYSKLIKQS